MILNVKTLFICSYLLGFMEAVPVVIKGSSPLGETIVAISSSDPEVEKYLSLNIPPHVTRSGMMLDPEDMLGPTRGFSIAGPGHAAAGTGRGFASSSTYNPFMFPMFNLPLNLEGLGLSNIGFPNWFRSLENFYEPNYNLGNGGLNTVAAINDNGHVYGKLNSVTFDNRARNQFENRKGFLQ